MILVINLRKEIVYFSFDFNLKIVRFFCRTLYIYIYIHTHTYTVTKNVKLQLCLWHEFYNIVLKPNVNYVYSPRVCSTTPPPPSNKPSRRNKSIVRWTLEPLMTDMNAFLYALTHSMTHLKASHLYAFGILQLQCVTPFCYKHVSEGLDGNSGYGIQCNGMQCRYSIQGIITEKQPSGVSGVEHPMKPSTCNHFRGIYFGAGNWTLWRQYHEADPWKKHSCDWQRARAANDRCVTVSHVKNGVSFS
jgi:hypothetical protein